MTYKESFQEYIAIANDVSLTEEEKIDSILQKFTEEETKFTKRNKKKLNKRIKKELGIDDPSRDLFIELN